MKSIPEVAIASGALRGTLTDAGGAVFKGIPFAEPPLGDLRWRPPARVKPWKGVRDAVSFGSPCIQGGAAGAGSSEDCLYLNVWTPEWPAKSAKAVMVWIHGGGNFAGAASEPTFDGESLARHGVVLVTTNYRLGVFGFFAHPELTRESPHHASGNYGLLDQVAALQWVQENIARFGGDPGNVTVFGESAGSLDINVLMTSPLSRGLFQRVIGESGPVIDLPPLAEAEKKGQALAARLQIEGDGVIRRLREMPAAGIAKAAGQGLAQMGPALGVVVDGWVFPESPVEVFASGKEQRAVLLLGSNSQELQKPFFPMRGALRDAIQAQYGPLAERALAAYGLNGAADPQPDPELGTVLAQWATDSQFRCGTVAELAWHTVAGNAGYQFQFSRAAPGREALGAPHGSEVPYVFGTLGRAAGGRTYDDTDRTISRTIQEYWTNFAKSGDPNGSSLPRWPKFNSATRAYVDFTSGGPVAKQGVRRDACEVYMQSLKLQLAK